ncbi:MAG: hypothetical protein IKV18_01300, partial [Alistipes sp.]|nr:hypothetical protein [Alistipes sp.]
EREYVVDEPEEDLYDDYDEPAEEEEDYSDTDFGDTPPEEEEPYETEEISYLVKIDVKIDDATDDAMEDDFYGDDELKGADEIQDSSMEDEEDM